MARPKPRESGERGGARAVVSGPRPSPSPPCGRNPHARRPTRQLQLFAPGTGSVTASVPAEARAAHGRADSPPRPADIVRTHALALLCTSGATIAIVLLHEELTHHAASTSAAAAASIVALAGGALIARPSTARRPRGDGAPATPALAAVTPIVGLAVVAGLLAVATRYVEALRGILVERFMHPPGLTLLFLQAPILAALVLIAALARRALGAVRDERAMQSHSSAGGGALRSRSIWILAVASIAAAALVARAAAAHSSLRFVPGILLISGVIVALARHPPVAADGRLNSPPPPLPLPRASVTRRAAALIFVVLLGLAAARISPRSEPPSWHSARNRPLSPATAVAAEFLATASARSTRLELELHAVAACPIDLGGPRFELAVVSADGARTDATVDDWRRLVRRCVRSLAPGGRIVLESPALAQMPKDVTALFPIRARESWRGYRLVVTGENNRYEAWVFGPDVGALADSYQPPAGFQLTMRPLQPPSNGGVAASSTGVQR